jgi:hypothetical protein
MPSRRAYENASLFSVARSQPPQTKKRQSWIPEYIDLTFNDLLNLESKQQVSKKLPKLQEPLPMKYTLSIDVFVDKVYIYS